VDKDQTAFAENVKAVARMSDAHKDAVKALIYSSGFTSLLEVLENRDKWDAIRIGIEEIANDLPEPPPPVVRAPVTRCEECGLPMVECSSLAMARRTAFRYLRERGYTGIEAREASDRLILHPARGR
jgi:hypothetical protein